ncbi:response regulator transcription factor [Hungatella sp.]|uniref:response regulator transcription factor n=1 Tax=Hungatella sp. TaxID=2613924 RepID=UPI003AB247ED
MYRLIIIDDEEKIVEGMGMLFPWNTIGYSVEGLFTSAVEALEFMEHNQVDVVLSDIEMPDMDGIELSRRLLEKEDVKVVLFSSHQDYDYFRAAIQNRVEDFLLKPVDYAMLLECLGRVKEQLDARSQKKAELPKGYYDKIVSSVREYLMRHYQDASLEGAAETVNLSPAYLSKIFKEKNGTSFSDTLLGIRMEKAKEMLGDIHYKSYDIAYYIGYDNPKNFSRAFKSYCGMTPMEFRKSRTGERQ